MIFDRTLMFSNAQAVTADAPSTDSVDLGTTGSMYGGATNLIRDIGKGGAIDLLIQVVETFNNLTSLRIVVQTSDDPTFATGTVDVQEQVVPVARLIAGFTSNINVVPAGTKLRYMRLFYDITGTAPTTGRVTAGIVAAVQTSGVAF